MNVPSIADAERILTEASRMNPGNWVDHNRVAGYAARRIADECKDMDGEIAYSLGLLHDIGRRFGKCDLRHIVNGYHYMLERGFSDAARICLTHSFPLKDMRCYTGENDCSADETDLIQRFLNDIQYNDYDRLIQLSDAISYPNGPCYIEKRLVDVTLRRGFNDYTVDKWKAFFEIKKYFDTKINRNLYELFDNFVIE